MKLSDKVVSKTHRVLVYGEPKSGKTQLVSELSSEFDLLYFDLENGYETMLKLPTNQQERVELISIPDTKTFPVAIETMLAVIKGQAVSICETHGKVSCSLCKKDSAPFTTVCLDSLPDTTIVVIDSLTQLSNSAMNHLTKGQPDLYKPEWADYYNQGQLLDKFLSSVQQARYNVACITHVIGAEQEDGKEKLFPVCGTSKFSRNTAKYFDHVVYCEVKNRKHMFGSSTLYTTNAMSGSRTGMEVEKMEVASLIPIFKGQVPVHAGAISGTQAQRAVTNLSKLLAKQKDEPGLCIDPVDLMK